MAVKLELCRNATFNADGALLAWGDAGGSVFVYELPKAHSRLATT